LQENQDRIVALFNVLDIRLPETLKTNEDSESPLTGKRFCVTGSFEGYSRDQLVEIGERAGGIFVSSVSRETDFLLA